MDFKVCSQCGMDIEEAGVQFKDRVFCSDECCDEYEVELSAKGIPPLEELEDLDDLDEEEDDLLSSGPDGLGYRDDDDLDGEFGDDEFAMLDDDF